MGAVNNKINATKYKLFSRISNIKSTKSDNLNILSKTRCSLTLYPLLANILIIWPAQADAGKIFDFNATLPIVAIQFLLLMVFLEKVWFGPVGKVIDDRNRKIAASRESLVSGTGELEALQKQAETLLKEARGEAKAKIADAKAALNAKAESELAAEKSRLDQEIALAVKELSNEKASVQKDIDSQVVELSQYIIKRVLPSGYTL